MLPEGLLEGLEDELEEPDGLDGLVERFCVDDEEEEPMLPLPFDPDEAVLPPEAG